MLEHNYLACIKLSSDKGKGVPLNFIINLNVGIIRANPMCMLVLIHFKFFLHKIILVAYIF